MSFVFHYLLLPVLKSKHKTFFAPMMDVYLFVVLLPRTANCTANPVSYPSMVFPSYPLLSMPSLMSQDFPGAVQRNLSLLWTDPSLSESQTVSVSRDCICCISLWKNFLIECILYYHLFRTVCDVKTHKLNTLDFFTVCDCRAIWSNVNILMQIRPIFWLCLLLLKNALGLVRNVVCT